MRKGKGYTEAVNHVAKKRGIKVQAVRDKTTRQLGFTGQGAKDTFLTLFETGKLRSRLIEKFPDAKERIEAIMGQYGSDPVWDEMPKASH
jgi:hypothetical protein